MPDLRLTSSTVKDLPLTERGQKVYFDTRLSGFGVRVGRRKKAYVAEGRVSGNTRRVTIGSAEVFSCEQARREAQRLLGEMASGRDPNAAKARRRAEVLTLEEAASEFFEMRDLAAKTEYGYRRILAVCFDDWLRRPMKDLSGEMVLRRFRVLSEERGPGYANLAMRVLRSIWNFARARFTSTDGSYVLPECPVKRLSEARMWHRLGRRQSVVTRTQLPAWYAAVSTLSSDRYPRAAEDVRDYLLVLLFTGLRRDEAASLRWDQVDLAARSITVLKTKNQEALSLPMSRQLHSILERRSGHRASVYVFPGTGRTRHIVDARKFLPLLRERSGVHFTHHDLRRTFITIAEGIDIPYYALKRLVNHAMSGDVTAGYIVRDIERLRKPMQLISDEIERLCSSEPSSTQASDHVLKQPPNRLHDVNSTGFSGSVRKIEYFQE